MHFHFVQGGAYAGPVSRRHSLKRLLRGHGEDDMLLIQPPAADAGLWIASDNFDGGTSCGGVKGFSGLCFLPYTS